MLFHGAVAPLANHHDPLWNRTRLNTISTLDTLDWSAREFLLFGLGPALERPAHLLPRYREGTAPGSKKLSAWVQREPGRFTSLYRAAREMHNAHSWRIVRRVWDAGALYGWLQQLQEIGELYNPDVVIAFEREEMHGHR